VTRRTASKAHAAAGILFAAVIAVTNGSAPSDAREVVEIVLHGKYFSEPATVRFMVAVEPDAENRTLRIEADSNDMFRASEITLNGASEKRLHTITFKNLSAGYYMLRAQVLSASDVRGMAVDDVVVTGMGLR
jgi:hypothetical protein